MPLPRLLKPLGRPQPTNMKSHLGEWFESELGQLFLHKQSVILEKLLPRFFGYHLIYSGFNPLSQTIEQSPIRHKVFLDCSRSQINTDIHQLPFQTDSTDLMILQHNLDFDRDPFQVLREATRVILPNGSLIIIGFNPWSLWGLWRTVLFRSSKAPWNSRFISPYRLAEWLDILSFDVVGCESGFYSPPLLRMGQNEPENWLDYPGSGWLAQRGGFYVLLAKKRVSCMTPVRLQTHRARSRMIPIAATGKVKAHTRKLADNYPEEH